MSRDYSALAWPLAMCASDCASVHAAGRCRAVRVERPAMLPSRRLGIDMDEGARYASERYARAWRKWWTEGLAEGLELGMTTADVERAQMSSQQSNEPQRFPIGESCDLLGIDRMTLKRWLDEARMQPQTDTIDKRYKYLTREQIVLLARRHNRIIRLEQQVQSGPRLSRREREHQARLEAVEAVVREHSAILRDIVQTLEVNSAHYTAQLGDILRLLGATPPPASSPAPAARELPPMPTLAPVPASARARRPRHVSTSRNPLPPLPDGWVAFRAFAADEMGVPETTALRRVRDGRWPQPHRGEWASGAAGTWAIVLAYDPDQQRVVRELMGKPEPSGDDDAE